MRATWTNLEKEELKREICKLNALKTTCADTQIAKNERPPRDNGVSAVKDTMETVPEESYLQKQKKPEKQSLRKGKGRQKEEKEASKYSVKKGCGSGCRR